MTRLSYLLAIAATVLLAAAIATAGGGTRPDDRRGDGRPGKTAPSVGTDPAPTVSVLPSPSVRVDGFDWTDAAIGAAAALGLGLLLAGASALVRRRHRIAEFP